MSTSHSAPRASSGRPSLPSSTSLRLVVAIAAASITTVGLAACSGGTGAASGTGTDHSTITVATLGPYTGPDAALGPIMQVGCTTGANAINAAGGVLGHPVACSSADTHGDPADAVPATRKLFASTPNLALIIGVTSDEASSVVPIINGNKMVVFAATGQSEFSHAKFDYFYRNVAPDAAESYAMVAIAQKKGFKKVALAFGNDIGSQTFVAPAIRALAKAGIAVSDNETLDLKANTFRTEASKIVDSHPDAIMTEALGPTEASFLSEVKQLNGGRMIPIIGTSTTIDPDWYKSVSQAVGAETLAANYTADNVAVETSGPGFEEFKSNLTAVKSKLPHPENFDAYLAGFGPAHLYDGVILSALAMNAANSTKPADYQRYIVDIGNGVPGAVEVHSYRDGVAALKAGKKVHYTGPGGPTTFDEFHNSIGLFKAMAYDAKGAVVTVAPITEAEMAALAG